MCGLTRASEALQAALIARLIGTSRPGRDELAKTRASGIATDIEENSLGICAVAAPLRLPSGELAAVSIPVPTQRFADQRQRLEAMLLKECGRLRRVLR